MHICDAARVRFLVSGSIEEHPRYIESEFSTRLPPLALQRHAERERERERGRKEGQARGRDLLFP